MAVHITARASKTTGTFSDMFLFWALIVLSGQGILNYLLGNSSLSAWKQALIVACFPIALFRIKTNFDLYLSLYVLGAICILVVIGSADGVATDTLTFNSFYYASWLPFYLAGRTFNLRLHADVVRRTFAALIFISAVGLLLQLYTPYLDFLKDQEAAELRARFGETQRFGFIFVTSTLVMPTLVGMYFPYLLVSRSIPSKLWTQLALVLAALPTGSLAGLIMLIASFGMTLSRMAIASAAPFMIAILLIVSSAAPFSDELIDRQIERMTGNTVETQSNQTRLALWQYAVDTFVEFPIEKQIFGAGLGVTNSNRASAATYAHGESSFFQALIEGGLVGLTLRLLPFALLLAYNVHRKGYTTDLAYGLGLLVCCASAPLFGGFGVQCLLGFNAGISQQRTR